MAWLYQNGWWFLLAAVAGELLVPLALAPFFPGYRHRTMALSALGGVNSPVRARYNLWMLAAGILFLLGIPALYGGCRHISWPLSVACCVALALFAVGACVFSCFFSVNDSRGTVTTASRIHGAGSAIGFIAMLLLPLFLAILSGRGGGGAMAVVCGVCFVLALGCFVLFIMGDKPAFRATPVAWEGLWQRLNLLFVYLPLAVAAVWALV